MESLQTRLAQAQEDIRDERRRADQVAEKLRQCQVDLETLPILRHGLLYVWTIYRTKLGSLLKTNFSMKNY